MPKSHRPYSVEFRQPIIELVRKGRTPEELAHQFEPAAQAIRNGCAKRRSTPASVPTA
jgi:transposase